MLCERLKERKQKLGLTTEQLSLLSGVPTGTINKILNGETKSPRYDTLAALEKALSDKELSADITYDASSRLSFVQETQNAYNVKKQGDYTIEDYYALPDDVRAELIDGVLFYMEAPSVEHQDIITSLIFEIELYIRSNKGSCKVFAAPVDVQLDCDNKTMVQPDIIVSCDKDKRHKKNIYGAPDLCIEITSPSTRKKDFLLKLQKYMAAGVREYWIVDTKREHVICYFFEGEDYTTFYTFQDKVPVHIFDNKLEIDFSYIKERLAEI